MRVVSTISSNFRQESKEVYHSKMSNCPFNVCACMPRRRRSSKHCVRTVCQLETESQREGVCDTERETCTESFPGSVMAAILSLSLSLSTPLLHLLLLLLLILTAAALWILGAQACCTEHAWQRVSSCSKLPPAPLLPLFQGKCNLCLGP